MEDEKRGKITAAIEAAMARARRVREDKADPATDDDKIRLLKKFHDGPLFENREALAPTAADQKALRALIAEELVEEEAETGHVRLTKAGRSNRGE